MFVPSKHRLRSNERKKKNLSVRLTAAVLKDFRSENKECGKYQLIFVTAEEVLSKPFLFSAENKMPHCSTHRPFVCLFLSKDSASGF